MTKTKTALFAIPIIAGLIAIGAISGTFSEKDSTSYEIPHVELQKSVIPQAFGEAPDFVTLRGTELVSQDFLDELEFIVQDVQCKVKMAETLADSKVMWCQFSGEINEPELAALLLELPAELVLEVLFLILSESGDMDTFIGLAIMEFLNVEIETKTGLDLSNPNGSEMEFSTSIENMDSEEDLKSSMSWKIKEMWS